MTMTTKLSRLVVAAGKLAAIRDQRNRDEWFSLAELDAVLDEIVAAHAALDDESKPGAS